MASYGDGPIPAKIMLVGEAWGEEEEKRHQPFVGNSGIELNKMLHEAGLMRSECYVTNLVNARPPGNDLGAWIAKRKKDITAAHVPLRDKYVLPIVVEGYQTLLKEIELVQPNVIAALGKYSTWALTGAWGILKWRGSHLRTDCSEAQFSGNWAPKVIPTIHPASVLREWSQRSLVVNDLKRIKRHMHSREYVLPKWKFVVRPSFQQAEQALLVLMLDMDHGKILWIDFDLETKAGHIDCAGISWSRLDAICIPFMSKQIKTGYWSEEEEAALVHLLWRVLTHKNARIRGQNLLYDSQYTYRSWHFIPNVAHDIMITQHSCFSAMRKSLDFVASLYCEHYVQWKPEKSSWKEDRAS